MNNIEILEKVQNSVTQKRNFKNENLDKNLNKLPSA